MWSWRPPGNKKARRYTQDVDGELDCGSRFWAYYSMPECSTEQTCLQSTSPFRAGVSLLLLHVEHLTEFVSAAPILT